MSRKAIAICHIKDIIYGMVCSKGAKNAKGSHAQKVLCPDVTQAKLD